MDNERDRRSFILSRVVYFSLCIALIYYAFWCGPTPIQMNMTEAVEEINRLRLQNHNLWCLAFALYLIIMAPHKN